MKNGRKWNPVFGITAVKHGGAAAAKKWANFAGRTSEQSDPSLATAAVERRRRGGKHGAAYAQRRGNRVRTGDHSEGQSSRKCGNCFGMCAPGTVRVEMYLNAILRVDASDMCAHIGTKQDD